jgi:hypothetical protein
VDSIRLPTQELHGFYTTWVQEEYQFQRSTNPQARVVDDNLRQKAVLLIGRHQDEAETVTDGAVQGLVEALYVPPQHKTPDGVRFRRDPQEDTVTAVSTALGLQVIGWVLATRPRPEHERYGGKAILSASEIMQAATFQSRFVDDLKHSKFCTVILEQAPVINFKAYQVSDQCVAMNEAGILAAAPDDVFQMAMLPERKGQLAPCVVYGDTSLQPGEKYLPDYFIVPVAPVKGEAALFRHKKFPSQGQDASLKNQLRSHVQSTQSQDYRTKLADFNLLVFLYRLFGSDLVLRMCHAYRDNQQFNAQITAELDQAFAANNLF